MENEPQINNEKSDIKTIHTYLSDMAETVRDNEVSVIKIAVAEQNKHEREDLYRKAEGTGLTKTLFILGGIILILSSYFVASYVIQKNKETNSPLTTTSDTNIKQAISYDSQSFVDTTQIENSDDFVTLLKPEINKIGKPDSISSIFLTNVIAGKNKILPLENFSSLLNLTAPSSLLRSLSDSYMVGVYTKQILASGEKPSLFLMFDVKDYNMVYAGMLEWEKSIVDDLSNIFEINKSNIEDGFKTQFKDIIINNKDARVLYDKDGNEILYYIFIDKNNLVITNKQETINKITTRLLLEKTKPL
jgi:hypothetical protein